MSATGELRCAGPAWTDAVSVTGTVRTLEVDDATISAEDVARFQAAQVQGLSALYLSRCAVAPAAWPALLAALPDLRDLGLRNIGPADAAIQALAAHRPAGLRRLLVSGCRLHDDSLAALGRSPLVRSVTDLSLIGVQLGDAGVAALASGHPPRLRFLSLRQNQICAAVPALLAWADRGHVDHIDLTENPLSAEGAHALYTQQALRAVPCRDLFALLGRSTLADILREHGAADGDHEALDLATLSRTAHSVTRARWAKAGARPFHGDFQLGAPDRQP